MKSGAQTNVTQSQTITFTIRHIIICKGSMKNATNMLECVLFDLTAMETWINWGNECHTVDRMDKKDIQASKPTANRNITANIKPFYLKEGWSLREGRNGHESLQRRETE